MASRVLQSGLYTCTVKTFCKAPFTCLLGGLGCGVGFRCGCVVFVQLGALGVCQGIGVGGPYRGPVGWARWTPVGNIAIDFTSVMNFSIRFTFGYILSICI